MICQKLTKQQASSDELNQKEKQKLLGLMVKKEEDLKKRNKICEVCGKVFIARKERVLISKWCSKKCFHLGYKCSVSTRKKIGLSMKGLTPWNKGKKRPEISGINHPNWKGGRIQVQGYIFIHSPNYPYRTKRNYVAEHRLIVEKYLGRYLKNKEVVHHINEKKHDNRIENLMVFDNAGYHACFHKKLKRKEHLK